MKIRNGRFSEVSVELSSVTRFPSYVSERCLVTAGLQQLIRWPSGMPGRSVQLRRGQLRSETPMAQKGAIQAPSCCHFISDMGLFVGEPEPDRHVDPPRQIETGACPEYGTT
jgi:hypothetical protein